MARGRNGSRKANEINPAIENRVGAGDEFSIVASAVDAARISQPHGSTALITTRIFTENFTGFTGIGFNSTPSAGQLDSDIWRVGGMSDSPNPAYGFTGNAGTDFGRGSLGVTNETAGGIWSITANQALAMQPTGTDGEPNGFFECRITNSSGLTANGFAIAFDWVYRNNADRADLLNFSYSTDGTTFINVPAAAFTTPGLLSAGTAFSYQAQSVNLSGLSVANGAFIYLRWTHVSSSGSGSRDEVGIDNITVDALTLQPGALAINNVEVTEGNTGTTECVFTVTRSGGSDGTVGATWTLVFAGANAADFAPGQPTSGTISFADGVLTQTITVLIQGDLDVEPQDLFRVDLSLPTGGATLADALGDGAINNDDVAPIPGTLAVGDASDLEAHGGQTSFFFTVTRTGGSDGAVSATWTLTLSGDADAADFDPFPQSGTVSFADGETMQSIEIFVHGDTDIEPDETFTLVLSAPTGGATLGDDTGLGTITNDDVPPPPEPVVDLNGPDGGGIDHAAGYTEDDSAGVSIGEADLTVSDDSGELVSVTITITDGIAGDVLFSDYPLFLMDISAVWNPDTFTLTLTSSAFPTEFASAFAEALTHIRFRHDGNNPTLGDTDPTRTISVVANDGTNSSTPALSTITITATDDAPIVDLDGPGGFVFWTVTFNEGGGGIAVADSDATVTSIEGGLFEISATLNNMQAGDVFYVADNPAVHEDISFDISVPGTIRVYHTGAATAADLAHALTYLRFRHDGNNPTFDGTEPQRSITFFASDNGGASTTTTTIDFNTVNQPAVIGGDTSGSVTEDGTQTTGGTLTIDDPDDVDTFVPFTSQPGLLAYGSFSLDTFGAWTFTLDNDAAQALGAGDTAVDTITVQAADGTTQLLSVTVNGANDGALIAGTDTGAVTEDGTLMASGTLSISDVDAGETVFAAQSAVPTAYGTFTLEADGDWSYELNNALPAVQALNTGQTLTDTIQVLSQDGTTHDVVITINGANEAPPPPPVVDLDSGTGGIDYVTSYTENGTGAFIGNGLTITSYNGMINGAVIELTAATIGDLLEITGALPPGITISSQTDTQIQLQGAATAAAYAAFIGSIRYLNTTDDPTDIIEDRTVEVWVFDDQAVSQTATVSIDVIGVNDITVLGGTVTGSALENNATNAEGTITADDLDFNESRVQSNSLTGTYGSFQIAQNGFWLYAPNDNNFLQGGEQVTDTFTVTSFDGSATIDVVITITGLNDAPSTFAFNLTGAMTEDGGSYVADGGAVAFDPDHDETGWQTGTFVTTYGTFVITNVPGQQLGEWTYTLNNAGAAVQGLRGGQQVIDSMQMLTIDGSAGFLLQIAINGVNDAATITGGNTGVVFEDSAFVFNGSLTVNDADNGENELVPLNQAGDNGYGNFEVQADGTWTYVLNLLHPDLETLDDGETLTDSILVTSEDGTDTETITVTIHGAGEAPTSTNLQGDVQTWTEGGPNVSVDVGNDATIADVDSANFDGGTLTVEITNIVAAQDELSVANIGGIFVNQGAQTVFFTGLPFATYTGGYATGNPMVFTFGSEATPAAVQALIRSLQYNNSNVDNPTAGLRNLSWTLTDGDGGALAMSSQVNVVAVNDAPSGTDVVRTFDEDTSYTFAAADFGFGDVDGNNFEQVRFTTVPPNGTLSYLGNQVSAGDFVHISVINAGQLVFTPNADVSGNGAASFTFQVGDNGGMLNGGQNLDQSANVFTFNITNLNDAPTSTGLAGDVQTWTEGGPNVSVDVGNDATIADVDGANFDGGTLTVEITNIVAAQDELSVANIGGIFVNQGAQTVFFTGLPFATYTGGYATGNPMVFTFGSEATPAAVQALIRSLQYNNSNVDNPTAGLRNLSWTLTDGDGGTLAMSSQVNVVAVNDAPQGLDGSINFYEDSALVFNDPTFFGYSDVEGHAFGGVWIDSVSGSGSWTLNGGALTTPVFVTAAQIAAGALVFTPAPNVSGNNYAEFTFRVADTGGTDNGGLDTDQSANTRVINVLAVNDTALFGALDGNPTFVENGPAVVLDADATLVDVELAAAGSYDGSTLWVQRAGGVAFAEDLFSFTGGTVTYVGSDAAGTVTSTASGSLQTIATAVRTGGAIFVTFNANATQADVNAVMQQLSYANSSDTPPASVQLQYVFSDGNSGAQGPGGATFAFGSVTVNITAVNDAPVNTVGGPVSVNEDSSVALTGVSIADPDGGPADTYTVLLTVQHGTLTIRTDVAGGITGANIVNAGNGTNGITVTGTLAQINATLAAANGLTYQGDLNFNGADQLSVSTWEGVPANAASFGAALTSAALTNPTGLVTGDVNGDGELDLVYIGDVAHQIGVRLGNGDGTFGATTSVIAGANPTEVRLVDIDGDLDLDLVSTDYAGGGSTFGSVGVNLNLGGGSFGAYQVIASLQSPYDVTSADLNGDGRVDLIVDRRDYGIVSVLIASGAPGSFAAPVHYTASSANITTGITVGDFTGDGRADIIAFNAGNKATGNPPGTVSILVNNGNGTFAAAVDIYTSGTVQPFDGQAHDLNNDGNLDLVFANYTVNDGLTVMLGNGNGTFGAGTFYALASDSTGLTIGDVNGDGIADLISGNGAAGSIGVFIGNGNGTFQARVDLGIGAAYAETTALGDFDGDGDLDIAVNRGSTTGQAVLLNTGTSPGDSDVRAITVNPVNDAPAGTDNSFLTTIDEDTTYTFSAADFGFTDLVEGNAFLSVIITTLPPGGTLTLSGNPVVAGQEIPVGQLGNLVFTPPPDASGTGRGMFTFQVRDNGGTANGGVDTDQSPNTFYLSVAAVNDAPVNSVPGAQSVNEDGSLTLSAANSNHIQIADVDPGSGTYTVTLSAAHGILTVAVVGGLAYVGNGTASVIISGTVADINTALATALFYNPDPDYHGPDTIQIVTSDNGNVGTGGALTDTDSVAITVNSVNDAPAGTNGSTTINEDASYTFSAADFGFTDPVEGDGLLSVVITTLPGAGTLTLSGNPVIAGQEIPAGQIGNLVFTPAADANGSGYASFTFQVRDNGGTANGGVDIDQSANTFTLNVTAVNDAPVNSVPGSQSVDEDGSLILGAAFGNRIQIADVDAGPGIVQVTLSVGHGILTVAVVGALAYVNNGTASVIIAGTVADINNALSTAVTYQPNADFNGTDTLTVTTSDGGNSGSGGALQDVDTVTINITAINDAPVVIGDGTESAATINEDSPSGGQTIQALFAGQYSDAADNQIPNGGASSPGQFSGIAVVANGSSPATGVWQYFNGASWVAIGPASPGAAVLLGSPFTTLIRFQPALDFNGPAPTLTVHLIDNSLPFGIVNGMVVDLSGPGATGGTTAYSTGTVVLSQDVTEVNDAPTVTITPSPTLGGMDMIAEWTDFENQTGEMPLLVWGDVNGMGANRIGLSVTFQNGLSGSVIYNNVSGLWNSIFNGVAYESATGFFTAADGLHLLYANAISLPMAWEDFVMPFSGNFDLDYNSGNSTFRADTPGWASAVFRTFSDAAPAADFSAVEQQVLDLKGTITVADVDAGSADVTVTLSVDYGILTVDPGASGVLVANSGTASVTLTGTLAEINNLLGANAVGAVSFTANTDDPPASAELSVTIDDGGNTGTGGTLTDTASVTINIAPVNDAPAGTDNMLTGSEDDPIVFTAADFGFSDPAEGDGLLAVRVTTLPGAGTLYLDTDGPGGAAPVAVSVGQSISIADINAGHFYFLGATDGFGSPYASFTFQVQDDGGTANGGVDLDQSANVMTINLTPDNLPPVVDLNGAGAGIDNIVAFIEDGAPVSIGLNLTVSDPDEVTPGDMIESATVTLTDRVAGDNLIYPTLPPGFTAVTTSSPTFITIEIFGTGTSAQYAAILAGFTYSTDSQDPTFGGTDLTRTITVTVNDGMVNSAMATTTVNITAVDDPPVAQPDAFTINENGSIVAGNLFASNGSGADTDPDGPPLSISAVNGSGANVGNAITLASGASLTVNANGTFDYNPGTAFLPTPTLGSGASNTPGQDSFTYTLAGGNTVTVTITLTGLDTDDTLLGTAGVDLLAGGNGSDTYYVENGADQVLEAAAAGNDRVIASVSWALGAGSEVETIEAAPGLAPINLTGNALNQTLIGNAAGNVLNGGAGADLLIGLGGDDIFVVDDAGDIVAEVAAGGSDTVYASISYGLAAGSQVEILSTLAHASTAAINLFGNEFAQIIVGNFGNNVLGGVTGADVLYGLAGDDTYVVADASAQVMEAAGGGTDTVYTSVSYTLTFGSEVEILSTIAHASTAAINLTGNSFSQVIVGNFGSNTLNGGLGADTLYGLAGDDLYIVHDGQAQVVEFAGGGADLVYTSTSWTLTAGSEVEVVSTSFHAGTGAINLTGNELANTLYGNNGVNVLDGKGGADLLVGLAGADRFAFTTALGGGNVDVVFGFESGIDKIALDDAIFGAIGPLGALNPNAFVTGTAAADGDDRIIYNSMTGQLFYDADGSGAGVAVQFATLSPGATLVASDFVVI